MKRTNKKRRVAHTSRSLRVVQEFFPKVTEVVDADEPLYAEVTEKDNQIATRKDHRICALAVACKRMTHATGVLIYLSVSYIIKGNTAIRYQNSGSVSREIIAFDRNAKFEEGIYKLSPHPDTHRIGATHYGSKTPGSRGNGNGKNKRRKFRHFTQGVRTVAGQYIPPGIMK